MPRERENDLRPFLHVCVVHGRYSFCDNECELLRN
jgi:hypothetical protein